MHPHTDGGHSLSLAPLAREASTVAAPRHSHLQVLVLQLGRRVKRRHDRSVVFGKMRQHEGGGCGRVCRNEATHGPQHRGPEGDQPGSLLQSGVLQRLLDVCEDCSSTSASIMSRNWSKSCLDGTVPARVDGLWVLIIICTCSHAYATVPRTNGRCRHGLHPVEHAHLCCSSIRPGLHPQSQLWRCSGH